MSKNLWPRGKDEKYWRFMDWKQAKNEIVVFTTYAFADLHLPPYKVVWAYKS